MGLGVLGWCLEAMIKAFLVSHKNTILNTLLYSGIFLLAFGLGYNLAGESAYELGVNNTLEWMQYEYLPAINCVYIPLNKIEKEGGFTPQINFSFNFTVPAP